MTFQIADTAKLHHARKTKITKLAIALAADWPALSLVPHYNEDESQLLKIEVVHTGPEGTTSVGSFDQTAIPEIGDLLEACDEAGVDPEEGFEEPKASGSVVPEGYRARYREVSSTKQSCGDWLAEQLAIDTRSGGDFLPDDFQAVLDNNSVDQSGRWARLPQSGQKGWIGRWRMNGRQALEKAVVLAGVYYNTTGNEVAPAADWLADMRAKHGKWLAKQRKAAEAADALAD